MFIVLGLYSRIWNLCLHQSVRSPCNLTNREFLNCKTTQWVPLGWSRGRSGPKFAKWHDVYTPEGCVDKRRQNFADFKLLCHEWFHHVRHHVHDSHCVGWFTTVIWRLDNFTVSFRGGVRGESDLKELALVNGRTPQWAHGRFTNTIMPAWLENGVI